MRRTNRHINLRNRHIDFYIVRLCQTNKDSIEKIRPLHKDIEGKSKREKLNRFHLILFCLYDHSLLFIRSIDPPPPPSSFLSIGRFSSIRKNKILFFCSQIFYSKRFKTRIVFVSTFFSNSFCLVILLSKDELGIAYV